MGLQYISVTNFIPTSSDCSNVHFMWTFKGFLVIDFFLLNPKQYHLHLMKCIGLCCMIYHVICPEECSVYS